MYIKEVYIDGFKSYASRTVLNGFDKSFNAITGLNGSGKSNILDAICFVLGISNLSQVRANNLTELIYKQGQAGITKASVSVVFDNSDQANSPVGYEDQSTITVQRQIMIGGKNKYMINGRNAQLNRVQNLFHSVQLNVNNPHFLIMQGRITKVLNMKPIEILGMIEEASGTRMFELKKSSAQKTISKKDKKLEEIERILSEEITPKLEKLKNERAKYLQYNTALEQLDSLERYCIAFEYYTLENQLEKMESDEKTSKQKIQDIKQSLEKYQNEEKEIQKKIESLKNQRQSQMRQEVTDLEQSVSKLNKELIQKRTEMESKNEEYKREENTVQELENQINEEMHNKEVLAKTCTEAKTKAEDMKKKIEEINTKIENLKKQQEAVTAGIAVNVNDGNGKTLTEQIFDCNQRISSLKTTLERNEMNIKHLKQSLEEKKVLMSKQSNEEANQKKHLEQNKEALNEIRKKIEELNFNEDKYRKTEEEIEDLEKKIQDKNNKINQLKSGLPHIFIDYNKQYVSGEVMGVIANLFRTKDQKNICALEVSAGPKLGQMVVDTEQTAKQVIQNGNLTRRVTTVPLNNISYNKKFENKELVNYASINGADLALNLITFEEKVENAMKYCFGTTLVAESMASAKKVAFDKKILARTVTLDGDLFEPSGTLTGGSRQFNMETSTLAKLEKLLGLEEELKDLIKKRDQIKSQQNQKLRQQFYTLREELQLKNHAYSLAEKRAQKSSYFETKTTIEEIEKKIKILQNDQVTSSEELKIKQTDIIELKKQQELFSKTSDEESLKQQNLKLIDTNIKRAKKELETVKSELKNIDSDKLSLRLSQIEEEILDLKKQYDERKRELESTFEKGFEESKLRVQELEKKFKEKNSKLSESRSQYSKSDEEIHKLNSKKEEISMNASDTKLTLREYEHNLSNMEKSKEKSNSILNTITNNNKWIKREKPNFNKEGTEFHFSKNKENLSACKQRFSEMKDNCENLSKTINKKAMALHEKTEQEYMELVKKKDIVEADKKKIGEVIEDLDEKKKKTIEETWRKVDEYFRSIFSMLLVGASAKLEPPADAQNGALDGLEVRVAFNGAWKESLTELSGGQRSLLALSLILALLRFKPAPVYILDEIDAALDPSHTQNIGRMLKQHFTNSQFIVVSLKEGMFQNANVLFKTKFVNGSSTVARVTNHLSAVESETEDSSGSPSYSPAPQLVKKRGTKRKSVHIAEEEEEEEE